jgi:hypothetical protein
MLFDLRGRGRRRTVQAIYLSLALLMGGGLVLFGIGGDVSGGLVDAFKENSGSDNELIENETKDAREAVAARPRDAAAWARLAQQEYQLAGVSDGFKGEEDPQNPFQGASRERLVAAEKAWDTHLRLAGDKPNAATAAIMRNVFDKTALNKPDKSVRAQEIVIESNPNAADGDYALLAVLAYQAGQTRKGDLAAKKAEDLAPTKERREQIKASIEAQKAQATQQAAQGAAGGAQAPAPTP